MCVYWVNPPPSLGLLPSEPEVSPNHATDANLAFTRYCHYQYCMVYSLQTKFRRGSRILPNDRAIVLHQGWQCRWAGG